MDSQEVFADAVEGVSGTLADGADGGARGVAGRGPDHEEAASGHVEDSVEAEGASESNDDVSEGLEDNLSEGGEDSVEESDESESDNVNEREEDLRIVSEENLSGGTMAPPAYQASPVDKKASDSISNYITYFSRVATCNGWSDADAARIFAAKLEVGSTVLDELDEDVKSSFQRIKEKLEPAVETYRESKVQEYFRMKMAPEEKVLDYVQRVKELVNAIYPKYAAANREGIARDRFIHGLSDDLKHAVLNGKNSKLEEAVECAMLAENVRKTLSSGRRGTTGAGGAHGSAPGAQGAPRGGEHGKKSGCFNCGSSFHRQAECKEAPRCYTCNSESHKAVDCPKKKKVTKFKPSVKSISVVQNRPVIKAVINGAKVDLLVDTGSSVSILSEKCFEATKKEEMTFRTANGQPLRISGRLEGQVTVQEWKGEHSFYVGEVTTNVLGMDFLHTSGATVDATEDQVRIHFKKESSKVQVAQVEEAATLDEEELEDEVDGLQRVFTVEKDPGYVVKSSDLFEEHGSEESEQQQDVLPPEAQQLMEDYEDVFTGLGHTELVTHRIETGDATPISSPSYRLPVNLLEKARVQIAELKRDGVVEKSTSEWSSPVILLKKKSGDIRVVIDFRKVNSVSKKDAFPMPRIDALLDGLQGSKVYSTLDCKSGYYQVGIREQDREKTAFRFDGELLQFTRTPFGLTSAPATFCRLAQKLFGGMKHVTVYIDDICVHSPSFEQHVKDLEAVFKRLREANLTLNPAKCHFFKDEIDFLGVTIKGDRITPMAEKSRAIADFPRPTSMKELKRFLGLTGYYRSMVPGYAKLAAPLYPMTSVTKKRSKFAWDAQAEAAFGALRTAFSESISRTMPDLSKPFKVRTDASMDGVGCLLLQERDGEDVIVEAGSKKFSDTERRYPVIEQEGFALMYALERWSHFLLGKNFILETDHRPLVWLQSKKGAHGKLGRWALRLAEFDFTVNYIRGQDNTADCLSRACVNAVDEGLLADQRADEALTAERLRSGTRFKEKDGGVMYFVDPQGKERLCIPANRKKAVWTSLHDDMGHLGQAKLRKMAAERYFWPRMREDFKKWAKSCRVCAVNKDFLPQPAPVPMVPVDSSCLDVNEKIALDAVGPWPEAETGEKYVLVTLDYFSKWTDATPVAALGGSTLVHWLRGHCARYGVPREIVLDRGSDMESKVFKDFCQSLGVKLTYIAPYHHQSNAVERFNRTLENILRACLNGAETSGWLEHLPTALLACRSAPSSAGPSPFEMMYGRTARLPVDVTFPSSTTAAPDSFAALTERFKVIRSDARGKLKAAGAGGKKAYDRARGVQERSFQCGRKVYWKAQNAHKLSPRWEGPFEIVQKVSETNYVIRGATAVRKEVHVNQLKECRDGNTDLGVLRGRGRPRKQ